MNLEDRLHWRDVLLGDTERQREIAELVSRTQGDPEVQAMTAAAGPALAALEQVANEHLPLGRPEEAVQFALARASAFSLEAVVEYCGAREQSGGRAVEEIRRLLAAHVADGRLTVEFVWDCPSCGNVLESREVLPSEPFSVFCEHGNCKAHRVVDPATAHAIFVNVNQDPALESWV